MIRKICQADIPQCVMVIKESFGTVAAEFGITEENAPRFTAFATNEERLLWHLNAEHRPMYGYFEAGKIVGYYSLLLYEPAGYFADSDIFCRHIRQSHSFFRNGML